MKGLGAAAAVLVGGVLGRAGVITEQMIVPLFVIAACLYALGVVVERVETRRRFSA